MKKSIAPIFAASILFLAGCFTAPHVAKWEYKVAVLPHASANEVPENIHAVQQSLLNDLGKDGWVWG